MILANGDKLLRSNKARERGSGLPGAVNCKGNEQKIKIIFVRFVHSDLSWGPSSVSSDKGCSEMGEERRTPSQTEIYVLLLTRQEGLQLCLCSPPLFCHWSHLQHIEIPRPGVKSELWLSHSHAGSLTH